MKKAIIYFFLLVGVVSLGAIEIIPQPSMVRAVSGSLDLPEMMPVHFESSFPNTQEALGTWAKEVGIQLVEPSGVMPILHVVKNNSISNKEGYKLEITSEEIKIIASTDNGAFYAVQTLRLLSDYAEKSTNLPCVKIEDSPRFPHRGFMLDSSRHFQSVDTVIRLLDQMALLKLNVFHWHLVDNHGWRVPVKSYPELTQKGGFLWDTLEVERNGAYTEEDIKAVVAHAKKLNIEIIPEIDVPGHSAAIAEVLPELLCPTNREKLPVSALATRQGNYDLHEILCLGNPDVFAVLETIFKDVIELMEVKRIHIGGDEVAHGIWGKCPLCSVKMKDFSGDKEYMMQKAFLNEVSAFLKKYNVKVINWGERPELGVPNVDYTQVWRGWSPQHLYKSTKQGVPTIVSTLEYAYFDYPDYPGTSKPKWMHTIPLKKVYTYRVIPIGYTKKQKEFIVGGEAALWVEQTLEAGIDEMLYPRMLAFSEQMWSIDKNRKWKSFTTRLPYVQKQFEARGVEFSKPVNRGALAPAGWKVSGPKHQRFNYVEYGVDGDDTTAYIGDENVIKGESYTISFPAKMVNRIEVITGGYYINDVRYSHLNGAAVEVSADGTTWNQIGVLDRGQLGIDFDSQELVGVRIVAQQNYDFPMCVNEVRIQ